MKKSERIGAENGKAMPRIKMFTLLLWLLQTVYFVQAYDQNDECGIWIAPSTIPGAGLGIFAGKFYHKGDILSEDSAIALTDLPMHNRNISYGAFLWDEYTWSAGTLKLHEEGVNEVNVVSFGFGAAANCILALLNVDEGWPVHLDLFNRSHDPGAGASTYWHFRPAIASKEIQPNQELFVSYGEEWFKGRPHLGPVPLYKEFEQATRLLSKLKTLHVSDDIKLSLYETFIQNTPFRESRLLKGSLGGVDLDNIFREFKGDVTAKKLDDTKRYDLRETGVCGDHMKISNSTLPHAGLGAFARRNLRANTIVGILPMIHILNRTQLDMYEVVPATSQLVVPHRLVGKQLLLNYCYGHRESSMLLCPYGPIVNYVNHNQTLANVKLQWVESGTNHQPELFNKTVTQFQASDAMAKLAMELVALRDIAADEEIFLDYGDEWEAAWQTHLTTWMPAEKADEYRSATYFQGCIHRQIPLRTVFEELLNPTYPNNVDLQCDSTFLRDEIWKQFYANGTLAQYLLDAEGKWMPCEVLRYTTGKNGDILYTLHLFDRMREDTINSRVIKEIPSDIFHFLDRPYTTDTFLDNAFRHDIRIPDELFPEKWRNEPSTQSAYE